MNNIRPWKNRGKTEILGGLVGAADRSGCTHLHPSPRHAQQTAAAADRTYGVNGGKRD